MSDTNDSTFRHKRSVVWSYFTPIDDTQATCNTCKRLMSYKSSTNNLRTHIFRKHKLVFESLKSISSSSPKHHKPVEDKLKKLTSLSESKLLASETSQTNVSASVLNIPKNVLIQTTVPISITDVKGRSLSTGLREEFNTRLIHFLIKNFHSLNILEEIEFKELIRFLNPTFQLPTESLMAKTLLPELYQSCVNATKKLINSGDIFCITLEIWSSIDLESYLTVTAHFVDKTYKKQALLLDCVTIMSNRNSKNLASMINNIAVDWGIEEKIQFAVSENNEELRVAINNDLNYEYFCCFGDTINLAVRDSIQDEAILKTIEKISQSIAHIKMDSELYEKIISAQKELGEINPGLNTLSDIHSFRSIYNMLDKYIKLESVIKSEVDDLEDMFPLNELEWKIAEQIQQVFKPFAYVMKTISSDNYCPASLVIPVVNGLHFVCDNLLKKSFVTSVKNVIQLIKKSLSTSLCTIESSATLSVCTFLDPRFKHFAFTSKASEIRAKDLVVSAGLVSLEDKVANSNSEHAHEKVEEEYLVWHVFDKAVRDSQLTKEQSTQQYKKEDDEISVWSSFDNTIAQKKPKLDAHSLVLAEVNRYMEADMLGREEDPLKWWKENTHLFPQLSILAKSQLCAVSTSVPSKRLFTNSGFVLNERRNNINSDNTKMFVFLNANIDILQ